MRKHQSMSFLVLSVLCIVQGGAAERDELIEELSKLIPPGTVVSSQTLDSNGFRLEFDRYRQLDTGFKPNGDEFQSAFVSATGAFRVQVVKGVAPNIKNGASIYHPGSGMPLVTLSDSDGDGRPDLLTYASVDAQGELTMEARDYDMDGQPDFRINLAERYFELWHVDRWRRVETRDGRRGVTLDGKFVELQRDKDRYVLP